MSICLESIIFSLNFYLNPQIKHVKYVRRFGTVSNQQINAFHDAIVRMIAEDLQPLSIVENSGFRHMIKLLDSR